MGYITHHDVQRAAEAVKARFGDRVGPSGEIMDPSMWLGRNGLAETLDAVFVRDLVRAGLYEQCDRDYVPASLTAIALHNSYEYILNLREQVRSLGGDPIPDFDGF